MRKNRRDLDEEVHDLIWSNPAAYTRASRRAAGYREPVHADAMRAFYAENNRILPRAVRRLFRDNGKAKARVERNRAKVERLLVPYGSV